MSRDESSRILYPSHLFHSLLSKPACRYDGDENATKEAVVPQAEVKPEPMETSITNENYTNHEEVKQENGVQGKNGVPDHDPHTYSSGQNRNGELSWNDGHGNGAQNNYGDVVGEPEQHGIGIKEDG